MGVWVDAHSSLPTARKVSFHNVLAGERVGNGLKRLLHLHWLWDAVVPNGCPGGWDIREGPGQINTRSVCGIRHC